MSLTSLSRFEFGYPGCEGSSSDFVSIYLMNLAMLLAAASPGHAVFSCDACLFPIRSSLHMCCWAVLLIMPLIIIFYRWAARNRSSAQYLPEWLLSRSMDAALYWKDRFVFAVLTWVCFATLILTTRFMSAIFCRKTGDEFRLSVSLDKVCGSTFKLWMVHLSGALGSIAIVVLYPLFIYLKIKKLMRNDLWNDDHETIKYGNFYSGAKVVGVASHCCPLPVFALQVSGPNGPTFSLSATS